MRARRPSTVGDRRGGEQGREPARNPENRVECTHATAWTLSTRSLVADVSGVVKTGPPRASFQPTVDTIAATLEPHLVRPVIRRGATRLVRLSLALSELVSAPVAVLAALLGVWRLGADLDLTGSFFINQGTLSHYQFWFAVAIAVRVSASVVAHRGGQYLRRS